MKKLMSVRSIAILIGIFVFLLGFGSNHEIEFKEGSLVIDISQGVLMAGTTNTDPNVTDYWAITCGGSYSDIIYSIQQTADGGYIMAGATGSFGAGAEDFWVLKLNADGSVAWQKTYGGNSMEYAYSIRETADGGYIAAGGTGSFGAGDRDIWVLKLKADGSVAWQKTYGGSSKEWAYSIEQTADGGYIVAGYTYSFGAGDGDIWALKLNADGSVAWQKTYGGSNYEYAHSVRQTADGGYILAGHIYSFGAGEGDIWVLKLNADGSVAWQKTYGGSSMEWASSIQQTADGGYVLAGHTYSFGAGAWDSWVLKLKVNGNIAWQKTYGGSDYEHAYCIQQTADGGYIMAGSTGSPGTGSCDSWVLKLNVDGSVAWQKTCGASHYEVAYCVQQTADGGYIMGGHTYSSGVGHLEYPDIWVSRRNSYGEIPGRVASGTTNATVSDTPAVGRDANAAIANSSAIISDTNISPLDSSAQMTIIRYETRKAASTATLQESIYRVVKTYPNPYSLSSTEPLTFSGTGVSHATIRIYTLSGELVKTLEETKGEDKITWDGRNENGERIVRGIYFYTTKNPKEKNTGKFTVVR